jgi:hypothetical protein
MVHDYRSLEKKLHKLQHMVRLEKARNEKLMEETIGTPVTFGSEIQLMHADSKAFICGSQSCVQNIKVGYECKLSQWYSKMMGFRILPKLKSRNEGELIQFKDLLMFENIENSSFLSFCFSKPVKHLHSNPTWASENPLRQIYNATNTDFFAYSCYLSMVPQTSFTCVLHSPNRKKDKTLYGQQFIRIAHTEMGGYLGSDLIYKEKTSIEDVQQAQVYLGVDNGEHAPEHSPGSSVWEVELLKISESGQAINLRDNPPFRDKFGEEEDEIDMEALEDSKWSVPIMLKHVVSNLRMESKPKQKQSTTDFMEAKNIPLLEDFRYVNNNTSYILRESIQDTSKLHMYLFPLVKLNKFAQVDQTYFIADCDFKFLKYNKTFHYKRNDTTKSKKFEKYKFKKHLEPLEDKDISTIKYKTYFSYGVSSKDTFLISRLKQQEIDDLLFVKSAVYHLNYLSEFFLRPYNSETGRTPTDYEYNRVYKILNKLTQFVVEQETVTGRGNADLSEGKPNQSRQHLIKDMGVIDLIMDIILFSMLNDYHNIDEINASSPFSPVLRVGYLTLRKSIEEYRPNELYASQWLSVIIAQSLNFTGENGVEANKTLKELIDNNKTILTNRITDTVVDSCIASLRNRAERDEKYLEILRALCICNGEAIVQNQKKLTESIVKCDPKIPSQALLIPFQMNEDDDIEIYVTGMNISEWVHLEDFLAHINTKYAGFYRYMLSMISLLSDMCFDRNYAAIEYLQEIYPINLCLTILMNEFCPYMMREVFGKLMSYLWIDVSPFYKIQLPNPIKTYEGLSNKLAFTHFHGKRIIYDKVKEYIPRFIRTLVRKPFIEDSHELRLMNTLLQLILYDSNHCRLMLELGMFSDVRELNEIIDTIKELLKKNFTLEYQNTDHNDIGFFQYCRFWFTSQDSKIRQKRSHEGRS